MFSRNLLEKGGKGMRKPRILLAEDHPMVREALRDLLNELGEVVGVVADGQALVESAQRLKPDIIFTDISMPKMNGLQAAHVLQTSVPQSKVVIVTSHHELAYVTLAFKAGARGFLLKRHSLHAELPQAFLHVLAGDHYIGLGVSEEHVPVDGDEVLTWRSEPQETAADSDAILASQASNGPHVEDNRTGRQSKAGRLRGSVVEKRRS